ncbi:MAG TPA: hypothetical protein PKD18_08560 [Saprospiraceae bacterium]|nr:hypothetical protein [Saprospiraceae bacterium]
MIKLYFLIFTISILNSCNLQTSDPHKEVQNGIVYFSFDNGVNWINSSNGLPGKISIGLGGIATSNQILGVATKEAGVYIYNIKSKIWENVPTEKQIIEANIGALAIFDNTLFVGTQFKGIFCKTDHGKNWTALNKGLTNLTIRRFCEYNS